MVLDGVRGQDQRLGHLCSRQAAGEEGGDLALASGRAERLEPDGRRARAGGPLEDDATRRSPGGPGSDAWSVIQPSLPGTVTTFDPP